MLKPGLTLYLIRHGETDWNRDARYQGQRDIPLNETGRAQARRNGDALAAISPQITNAEFVASPLERAVETMQIVRTQIGLPPDAFRRDDGLRELHYGHWEGQLARDLPRNDPDGLAAKSRDPYRWRPSGGESYADLRDRVARWLATCTRDTVAVSHGGVSRVARGIILDVPADDIPFLEVPQDRILVLADGAMRWL